MKVIKSKSISQDKEVANPVFDGHLFSDVDKGFKVEIEPRDIPGIKKLINAMESRNEKI